MRRFGACDRWLLRRSCTHQPRLWWDEAGPSLGPEDAAAEVARTAIELLASGRLRQCGNPRCILYFLAEGRRQFCSDTCANRTRVARHAARDQAGG